jgi:predicted  nucleic acid-binding Zn-ribbon protein
MELKELLPLGAAGVGVAFGFGRQAANLQSLKRDVDFIGRSHRDISESLADIRDRLARIEQDITHLKNK